MNDGYPLRASSDWTATSTWQNPSFTGDFLPSERSVGESGFSAHYRIGNLALGSAMRRHGVPAEILTDNGKVFTGRFGPGTGEVLFDRICRENGIQHILTRPRSPTTMGKIERWHKTLRVEFLTGKVFDSIADAQAQLDVWVEHYNHVRPHSSLNYLTPMEFVAAQSGAKTSSCMQLDYQLTALPPPAIYQSGLYHQMD